MRCNNLGKIKVLTDKVIQQIAAGEVVERPASVVKELVENALDAGAKRIELEVEKAGFDLISVRDDGCGMTAEDALLALTRHATSKITSTEDLAAIATLGFRGEALPSIAAVSNFKMITATEGALSGVCIDSYGGSPPEVTLCEAIPGTWISVQNLFFNTPARLKFLKSERTELKHITDTITRLAMVRPDVSFRALSQGRELITTSGSGKRKEVVELVLGKGSVIPWIEIDTTGPLGRLTGYIAPVQFARGSRNFQTVAVNGRWVKCPLVVSAVETAFKPQLVRNCHPVFFLELVIDPKLVDINVHPAKLEIRLSRDQEIWQFIYHAIKTVLKQGSQLLTSYANHESKIDNNTTGNPAAMLPALLKENTIPYTSIIQTNQSDSGTGIWAATSDKVNPDYSEQLALPISTSSWPQLKYVGQVLRTYLVAEGVKDVFLVDQHAAHERILYERIKKTWQQNQIPLQQLLVPQTFTVTEKELTLWKEKKDLWLKAGIVLEEFGPDTLVLRSIPQIMSLPAAITLIQELLSEELGNQDKLAWEQERHHLQATLACHAALKAGQILTADEATQLIAQLGCCQHPFNCPHGRPTLICLSQRELDRRFLRRLT